MKKLIETALPLSKINAITYKEWTGAPGHPANLHPWWGRSPINSTAAILRASLIDTVDDREELKKRMERILTDDFTGTSGPAVFDPFTGYGGIPLAAQKNGLSAITSDLNPVGVLLSKAAAELPHKFSGRCAANEMAVFSKSHGAEQLADDVLYYGKWIYGKAAERLSSLYPNATNGKTAAWIWTRTIKCPNPTCGCEMPLVTSYIICSRKGHEAWAEPVNASGKCNFVIHKGVCPEEKKTNKIGRARLGFSCPFCGAVATEPYIRKEFEAHKTGAALMCTAVDTDAGREYTAPDPLQSEAAKVVCPETALTGEMPANSPWFSPVFFGFRNFSDLYSPRQLTMLNTLCNLLREAQIKAASDALSVGMDPTGGSLEHGGTGALAYGQAIGVYLALVINRFAECNSAFCTWRTAEGNVRNMISHYKVPMTWTFAEGNPFSNITGNFLTVLNSVVQSIGKLPCGSTVAVTQADAVIESFPNQVLVCTELPYYKNFDYAHMSDIYYIWMRQSLKDVFPDLFSTMLTPKEELSTVGQYYGEEQRECEARYEANMRTVIEKLCRASASDYPALLFYEYHRIDEEVIRTGSPESSPWEKMLQAVIDAGFAVSAVWPARLEPASEKADGCRVLIVARKQEKTDQTTRRAVINTLRRELPGKTGIAFCAGVDDCDRELVAMGCGLSVITRYKKVLNADGSSLSVHDALQIIYQETKEYCQKTRECCQETREYCQETKSENRI